MSRELLLADDLNAQMAEGKRTVEGVFGVEAERKGAGACEGKQRFAELHGASASGKPTTLCAFVRLPAPPHACGSLRFRLDAAQR